ncbi:hypothetical protein [Mycobacterium sp. shizuoka-1]|uniref:hypothetical protein n=1 Tax=Mycobacterium sp. shizuoka-1 TaxID=2039281 RepID=UPI000C063810|nr:hypothetical protein [Mycobacterium sp. shizuoka-1]GAY16226.1 hypothetical protein MSZK_29520 [Mycobacterium sp. shizuoka-1]
MRDEGTAMRRYGVLAAVVVAPLWFSAGLAHSDVPAPQPGAPCPAEFADVMTQLPGGADFLVCQAAPDTAGSWVPVVTPFDPSSRWLSYGPEITLHGQGFRNPNLRSGSWTAEPLNPDAVCGADQVTVVSAGVLAPLEHSQSEPGQPMQLEVLPRLFTIVLSGDCLWSEDQPSPPMGW